MATCCSLQLCTIHFWQVFTFTCCLCFTPAVVLFGVNNVFIALFSHFPPFPPFPLFLVLMVHVTCNNCNILRQQRHSFLILSLANLAEVTPLLSIASRLCKTQRTKIDAEFSLYTKSWEWTEMEVPQNCLKRILLTQWYSCLHIYNAFNYLKPLLKQYKMIWLWTLQELDGLDELVILLRL